jgi:hypothetical protein
MKRFLVVAASAAVLVGAGATGAFAGEVKGPPGTPCDSSDPQNSDCVPSTNRTGAPEHSNSACSYSGLNDMTPGQGPTDTITQTPKGSKGAPGHGAGEDFPIGCRGGSNPERGGEPS